MLNNDLPRSVNDIPSRIAYGNKKFWTILDKSKRVMGTLNLTDENVSLSFELPREDVASFSNIQVKETTSIDGPTSRMMLCGSYIHETPLTAMFRRGSGRMRLSPSVVLLKSSAGPMPTNVLNITSYLPGIGEWFKEDFLAFDYAEYKFKQPKTIYHEIPLGSFATATLNAKLTIDSDSAIMDSKFTAYTESYVTIKFKEPTKIESAINLIGHVENFFNFIFSVPYASHVFTSKLTGRKPIRTPLYIVSPKKYKPYNRDDKKYNSTMLFAFEDISNVNEVFIRWLLKYDDIKDIVDTLVLLKSTTVSEEMRFTSVINALESSHRRFYDHKDQSDEDFAIRVTDILTHIPDASDAALVRRKLSYGNEMSLRSRLKEVYELGEAHGVAKPSSATTNQIINTRNYLTHGDAAGRSSILPAHELAAANGLLGRYLKIILLKNIGLLDDELTEIVSKSAQFQVFYRDEPPSTNTYYW